MKTTFTFLLLFFLLGKVGMAQSIVNQGFETGSLSSWTPWTPAGGGAPQATTTNPHTGVYAARLSGGVCSIEQVVTGLQPWRQYTLTAWIKLAHTTDSATLGVKAYNGSLSTTVKARGTTYAQYSISFTTGASNNKATIYFLISDTAVQAYGDDFDVVAQATPVSTTFYIDNVNGNDTNNGHSPSTAWKTLAKVNATTFFPGDSLLFKYNGVWTGTLHPLGEGATGRPIVISSYGGDSSLPLINGNGAQRCVYLSNQQYWDISHLELTNTASPGTLKKGIEVENIDRGQLSCIKIHDNNVHDMYGDNNKGQNGSMGIMVVVRKGSYGQTPSWFDSVFIENNIVKNVRRTGIGTSSDWRCKAEWRCAANTGYYPTTHMVIRNNYVENAGGDGIVPMVAYGALVEHNMVNGANVNSGQTANAGIWCWGSIKTLFQYNEAFNVKTAIDGEGYDVDVAQDSTIFQYNYSHDNQGGFMLLCADTTGTNTNAIVRYNISQNDRYRIIMFNGSVNKAQIYNNTMYLPAGSTTGPIVVDHWGAGIPYPSDVYVRNNIFYLAAAGPWSKWDSITGASVFDNNIVYGVHTAGEPTGSNNLTSDPQLVAPGTGTTGALVGGVLSYGNADGYKIQSNSPAIGAGLLMPVNGGRDYWGNTVSNVLVPNIGADNNYADPGMPAARKLNTIQPESLIYPNPVRKGEIITTLVKAMAPGTGVYKIVDAGGKLVYQKQVGLNKGNNFVRTTLPAVQSGLYFIQVSTGKEKIVYRFLAE